MVIFHSYVSFPTFCQWEFQDPKMEVPTIYKAYFLGLCKGISPQNMARNMVLTYLQFRILEFPLILDELHRWVTLIWMLGTGKPRLTGEKTHGFRPLLLTDVETRCPNCWIVESSVKFWVRWCFPPDFPDVQLFNHIKCRVLSQKMSVVLAVFTACSTLCASQGIPSG